MLHKKESSTNHGQAASGMVQIIRGIVQDELKQYGATALCQVISPSKDKDHFDLLLVSDPTVVLEGIVNMTRFDLQTGDYCYIYKINNSFETSFVCYKIN